MNIRDAVFYNGGRGSADGNKYWDRYKKVHFAYVAVMLFIMSVLVGIVSLFACSTFANNAGWNIFFSYFESPAIIILNLLPCVLLTFLIWFASGRAWIAFCSSSAIIFILTLVNYYKIRLRLEPFTARDIALVFEMSDIISNYTLEFTGRVAVVAAAFAAGTVFAVFFMKGVLPGKWFRIIGSAVIIILCAALFFTVYSSDSVYAKVENNSENIDIDRWATLDTYVSKGFLFPFLHTVKDAVPTPPEGYDEDETAALLAALPEGSIAEDKKVNVISVMLEAYSDLSVFEEVNLTEDIYAPLHALQSESWHGNIVTNSFGGGTLDAERAFLTGYPTYDDYNRKTDSYVWFLRSQGYYTEGVHPGLSWFYSRKSVNDYLGFENYYFLGDLEGFDRADELFFSTLRRLYDERDAGKPYFSFSVSFQNHGAYDSLSTGEVSYVEKDSMSEASYNILNNYLTGIADTTERMYAFADSFRESEEPMVLVFFGDHMPLLGDGNSVYNELGINMDLGTEEGFYNYYSTPFIIWANDAAKSALGNSFSGESDSLSPCFLMNELFELCSWEAPPFMGVSNELYETVTVVSTPTEYFCENGVLTTELSDSAKAAYDKFIYAQYLSKYNFSY